MIEKNSLTLAEKLKKLRKEYSMTQDDIAEILEMNRTSFSKYENGVANPPLSILRKLSKIYNTPIEYLIHDESSGCMILRASTEEDLSLAEEDFKVFAQLTAEERRIILKVRLMTKEEKENFLKTINSDI